MTIIMYSFYLVNAGSFLLIIVLYIFIIVHTPVPMVFVSVFTLVHCFRGILL